MRGEGIQHLQQQTDRGDGARGCGDERVRADHHLRDGGVEAEVLDVFADFFDRGVDDFCERLFHRHVLHGGAALPLAGLVFLHHETPHAGEETEHALDAAHAPRLRGFERAHEHLVKPQRVGAVFLDDVVGVHDVAARLAHLHAVLAEDEALVDEFLKWLGRADVAEVEQDLVPEARVEQVQHGVLGAADVEVHAAVGNFVIGDW